MTCCADAAAADAAAAAVAAFGCCARHFLPAGQVGKHVFGNDMVRVEHARGRM